MEREGSSFSVMSYKIYLNINIRDKNKSNKENKSIDAKVCLCFSFWAITEEFPFDE